MVDETKTILIIGIVAGGIGLLSGVFIIYAHYLKIKQSLEKRLLQAEQELIDDIREIPVSELTQTEAGRELLSILETEKWFRLFNILSGTSLSIAYHDEQLLPSLIKINEKKWRFEFYQPSPNTFIIRNVVYRAKTTFFSMVFSMVVRTTFSLLSFLGFLTKIGVSTPDLERIAESARKRSA